MEPVNEIPEMGNIMSGAGKSIWRDENGEPLTFICPGCGRDSTPVAELFNGSANAMVALPNPGDIVIHNSCGTPAVFYMNAETGKMDIRPPFMIEIMEAIRTMRR